MRHKNENIVLVASRDEDKIDQVLNALKNAIEEAERGNLSYSQVFQMQVFQMNGDFVNRHGNFGADFEKEKLTSIKSN
jgi:hypothetical protein